MGRTLLDYLESDSGTIYRCGSCRAHLARAEAIESKAFQGSSGPAWLFNAVINVTRGPSDDRILTTGVHTVRDIYCACCEDYVGWFYDRAFEPSQRYKEGKWILERQRLSTEPFVVTTPLMLAAAASGSSSYASSPLLAAASSAGAAGHIALANYLNAAFLSRSVASNAAIAASGGGGGGAGGGGSVRVSIQPLSGAAVASSTASSVAASPASSAPSTPALTATNAGAHAVSSGAAASNAAAAAAIAPTNVSINASATASAAAAAVSGSSITAATTPPLPSPSAAHGSSSSHHTTGTQTNRRS